MVTLPHRHQAWAGALALILGFSLAASPTFAPPLAPNAAEPRGTPLPARENIDPVDAFGANYVDENIALREAHVAAFRLRAHEAADSEARRDARARLPDLERELGELRCLRQ